MKYKQITVNTTKEFSEIAAYILTECGSEGLVIVDDEEMRQILIDTHWDYVDERLLGECSSVVKVSGFFAQDYDVSIIQAELDRLNAQNIELICTLIDSADWENVWKKYYTPIKIRNVAIVPNWLKNTHKNTIPVFINPGMAFGTGSHETTSMCIELMQNIQIQGLKVADIGCGSGILGLVALKLGAKECLFVDTDINAINATKENVSYNKVEGAKIVCGSLLEKSNEHFDVVLANLTADLLIALYNALIFHVKSGGLIVISGIIKERLTQVYECYSKDFIIKHELAKGEWRAALLEKI